MSKIKLVQLAPQHIRIDGGTQPRAEINEAMVKEYAEAMEEGTELPPAIVFYDGSNNWLADGFHRYHAAALLKRRLSCEVRPGTRRDAILHSVGANATHGLRRTNADKRKAVETLLQDEEWKSWSDNHIAKSCGVSQPFVGDIRRSLKTVLSEDADEERFYTTKHGTSAKMSTAQIGAKSEPEAAPEPQILEGEVLASEPDDEEESLEEESDSDRDLDAWQTPIRDPFDEDEAEAAMSVSSEPEPQVLAATSAPKEEIVYDTLKQNAPAVEADLDDEAWLQTIGAFRVLSATSNRGIIARRCLLSYRAAQKALGALSRAWNGHTDTKNLDANDPVASSIGKAARLPHPRGWFLCATCRGRGCSRCGLSGLDPYAGIDPTRVERGEVALETEVTP